MSPYEVRFGKEDEDCLDTCCRGVLKVCNVGYVKVYVVVYIHQMRCGDWVPVVIKDTCVDVIFDGLC